MKRRSLRFAIAAISLVLISGLAVMAEQLRRHRELCREQVGLHAELDELRRLRAENARLTTQLVSMGAAERERTDAAALKQLRAEVAQLRDRARLGSLPPAAPSVSAHASEAAKPSALPASVPASAWACAGNATPRATVETALWAAAGGDVDRLTPLLEFSAESRAAAEALFATLSSNERARHGTPERLVALLTAGDVPLGVVRWTDPVREGEDAATMRVQLRDAAGQERDVNLRLRRRADGWRLVVPTTALQAYAAQLTGEWPAGAD